VEKYGLEVIHSLVSLREHFCPLSKYIVTGAGSFFSLIKIESPGLETDE
jgi:hypothetical protein